MRHLKKINGIFTIVLLFLFVNISMGLEQWTQWRGPNRDGIFLSLPETWPDHLTKKWQIQIGTGHSTPVVWNDRVFTFSREKEEEVARAIDVATGAILWRSSYPAPYDVYPGAAGHGAGPRSTPVVSQHGLFTFGISGILSAFDLQKGNLKWQKQFAGKFAEAAPPFGASMSPVLAGELLVVHVGGHKGGALMAFDQRTGAEKWTLPGEGPSYSSPIVVNLHGTQQVVLQAHRKAMGVDLFSGKLLWSIPFVTPCDQNIVTPVQAGDLLIFSSLDTGTFAIRVQKKANVWIAEKTWVNSDVSMYMSSPVLIDGALYGMSHKKQGQFFALDARTGSTIWVSQGNIAENAAIVGNHQSILILKEDGELHVLPARAKKFTATQNYVVSNSQTWAHPVPIKSGLLIKDENSLILWDYQANGKTPDKPTAR